MCGRTVADVSLLVSELLLLLLTACEVPARLADCTHDGCPMAAIPVAETGAEVTRLMRKTLRENV